MRKVPRRPSVPEKSPVPSTAGTLAAGAAFCLIVAAGLGLHLHTKYSGRATTPTLAVGQPAPISSGISDSTDDERLSEAVVGTWQDFYHGRRIMTIRPDGTATMLVELSGWKARLFTPRLRLEMVWTVEGGKLNRRTVGGEPADKVEYVNRRVGDRCSEPILELSGDRMRLLDQNGSQQYDWRRVR